MLVKSTEMYKVTIPWLYNESCSIEKRHLTNGSDNYRDLSRHVSRKGINNNNNYYCYYY